MKFFMSMKATFLIVGSFLCIYPMHGTEQKEAKAEAQPFATHGMAIILDESENSIRAATSTLLSAFSEQAFPILFSGSLLHAYYNHPLFEEYIKKVFEESTNTLEKKIAQKFVLYLNTLTKVLHDELNKGTTESHLIEKLNAITSKYKPEEKKQLELAQKMYNSFLVKSSFFLDFSAWNIYRVNEYLFLAIPKKYEQSIPNNFNKAIQSFYSSPTSSFPTTQKELLLGLRIDHLDHIKNPKDYFLKTFEKAVGHVPTSFYFNRETLELLFIQQNEYAKILGNKALWTYNQIPVRPQWAITLFGHGVYDKSIASLSFDDFKKLLNFLASNILTKIFLYNSCYAAGTNLEKVFLDQQKIVSHSFVIACGALIEAPTASQLSVSLFDFDNESIDFSTKSLRLKNPIKWKQFIEGVTRETPNFPHLVSYILPVIEKFDLQTESLLKLPGMTWFNPLNLHNQLVSLGSILLTTRTEPLDLIRFFNLNKRFVDEKEIKAQETKNLSTIKGILLYGYKVPFELIIDTKTMPTLVSMLPGRSVHTFKKIRSSTLTLEDVINSFKKIAHLRTEKIFHIQQLQVKNSAKNASIVFKDFMVHFFAGFLSIYYTVDNKKYHYESPDFQQEEMNPSDEFYNYLSIIKSISEAENIQMKEAYASEEGAQRNRQEIENIYKKRIIELKQRELKLKQLEEQAERKSQEEQKEEKQNA